MSKNNLMLDIETLGTGSDAVVISIGAVLFDPLTGELGDSFYRALNYQDQIDKNRKPSYDTIKWWLSQSKEAQEVFNEANVTTSEALVDFYAFCKNVNRLKPWGNGPSFDLTIVETLFKDFGYSELPWSFWNVRCFRTFREYIYDGNETVREGVHHNAIDDCKHQIKVIKEGLAKNGEKK